MSTWRPTSVLVVGKRGTGKTVILRDLLFRMHRDVSSVAIMTLTPEEWAGVHGASFLTVDQELPWQGRYGANGPVVVLIIDGPELKRGVPGLRHLLEPVPRPVELIHRCDHSCCTGHAAHPSLGANAWRDGDSSDQGKRLYDVAHYNASRTQQTLESSKGAVLRSARKKRIQTQISGNFTCEVGVRHPIDAYPP